jgi:hypothetical protein
MKTHLEIFNEIENLISHEIMKKYAYLSYGEMAEWSEELKQADLDWYLSD